VRANNNTIATIATIVEGRKYLTTAYLFSLLYHNRTVTYFCHPIILSGKTAVLYAYG
jgi:hypothetical protein